MSPQELLAAAEQLAADCAALIARERATREVAAEPGLPVAAPEPLAAADALPAEVPEPLAAAETPALPLRKQATAAELAALRQTAAQDVQLKETNLASWRVVHANDPEEVARREREATAEMADSLRRGVRPRL
jgi:hypothetical protein